MNTEEKDLQENFLEHFKTHHANETLACDEAKITREQFKQWCDTDAGFNAKVEDIKEQALDFVEGKLMEKITGVLYMKDENKPGKTYTTAPDTSSIIFYLKAKGRKRGVGKDAPGESNDDEQISGFRIAGIAGED